VQLETLKHCCPEDCAYGDAKNQNSQKRLQHLTFSSTGYSLPRAAAAQLPSFSNRQRKFAAAGAVGYRNMRSLFIHWVLTYLSMLVKRLLIFAGDFMKTVVVRRTCRFCASLIPGKLDATTLQR
jgi:hypothetical protein